MRVEYSLRNPHSIHPGVDYRFVSDQWWVIELNIARPAEGIWSDEIINEGKKAKKIKIKINIY